MARRLEEEELWEGRVTRIIWEGKEERWKRGESGQVDAREEARQKEGKKWLEWWEGRRRDRKLKQKFKEEEAIAEWADGEWKDWTAWMKALQEPAWGRWKWEVKMTEEEERYEIRVEEVGLRQLMRISKIQEDYRREQREKRLSSRRATSQNPGKRMQRGRGANQEAAGGSDLSWEERLECSCKEREGIMARALLQWNGEEEMSMAKRSKEIAAQGLKNEMKQISREKARLNQGMAARKQMKEEKIQVARDWE